MSFIQSLTDKQLLRLFNRILDRINSEFRGGGCFGIGLPTLHACYPEMAESYRIVRAEGRRRTIAKSVNQ